MKFVLNGLDVNSFHTIQGSSKGSQDIIARINVNYLRHFLCSPAKTIFSHFQGVIRDEKELEMLGPDVKKAYSERQPDIYDAGWSSK